MEIYKQIEKRRERRFSEFVDEVRKISVLSRTEEECERAFFESTPWQSRVSLKERFYLSKAEFAVKNGQKTALNA